MDEKNRIQEELLVLRCQLGDADAYKVLIAMMEERLFFYIRHLVPTENDAYDVLQEVWVTVIRKIKKLLHPKAFRPWIYRIAHDHAINLIRHQIHQDKIQESYAEESISNEEDPFPDPENAIHIHHALKKLNLRHRQVLTLFFMENMSYEEISQVLRCNMGTIKSRMHNAKKELRLLLEGEDAGRK